MFLGVRDIRFAKGRFGLMGAVIALMTFLLVMLSGLTQGLSKQNTSALEYLDPDVFVLSQGSDGEPSFTQSSISAQQASEWRDAAGRVEPLGISQTRLEVAGVADAVAVFGVHGVQGVLVPPEFEGASQVKVAGQEFAVAGVAPELAYSHLPVVFMGFDQWTQVAHLDEPTALLAWDVGNAAAIAPDVVAGTVALSVRDSFAALPAYSSERGSLVAMQGLLFGISALIIVAFLTVWTLQRTRDIAILRALGASGGYVLKDAVGQAVLVVVAGVLVGGAAGAGLGVVASRVLPFEVTLIMPMVGVVVLGVAGAVIATRKVTHVDPKIALGA